jgi:FkbM family methyltransferase
MSRAVSALNVADARSILLSGQPLPVGPSLPRGVYGLLAENPHGRYVVPRESMHRPAAKMILDGDIYERSTLQFLAEQASGGVVVHAGTYFGDFLPRLSYSATAVLAFEPNPTNFHCAQMTVWLNGLKNVQLTHAGLSNTAGELRLRVKDAAGRALGGGSRLLSDESHNSDGGDIAVPVRTLDQVIDPSTPVAVVQLDVEGHEQQALSGALTLLNRWKPTLVLETVPDLGWLEEFLPDYSVTALVDRNTVLAART